MKKIREFYSAYKQNMNSMLDGDLDRDTIADFLCDRVGDYELFKAVAFTSNERIIFLYYTVDENNVKTFEIPIREYEEYIESVS